MFKLFKESLKVLKSKGNKIEPTNEYLKQLEYLNKVNNR